MSTVPLYILTGFLGSGKTSVIRSLLEQLPKKRIGIILNDFGSLGIDVSLIPSSEGIITRELAGGQIFCSCLSGSFVETAVKFKDLDISMLLVEASGLSKPAPLMEIISYIHEKSSGHFTYRGMICVIDAENYLTVSQSLLTLEEQAVFSDLFVINKTDLADESQIQLITESLKRIRPEGRVVRAVHGKVPLDILDVAAGDTAEPDEQTALRYQGWQSPGRPKSFVLEPVSPVSLKGLRSFIKEASASCYRMKGYVITDDDRRVYVSAAGSQVEILPADHASAPQGIVVLQKANGTGDKVFPSRWMLHTGTTVRIRS